jgi:hypothetical protein
MVETGVSALVTRLRHGGRNDIGHWMMDRETAAKFEAVQERLDVLQQQLDELRAPRPTGQTICLKEAAARSGYSTETVRRRLIADPSLGQKRGGRWAIHPDHLNNTARSMK